ncbi:hypothetical protein HK101_008511 [Irineochytrium annulatum]|nr:hypothetical protein HK101_008511 [Irineochytrium annulatum]
MPTNTASLGVRRHSTPPIVADDDEAGKPMSHPPTPLASPLPGAVELSSRGGGAMEAAAALVGLREEATQAVELLAGWLIGKRTRRDDEDEPEEDEDAHDAPVSAASNAAASNGFAFEALLGVVEAEASRRPAKVSRRAAEVMALMHIGDDAERAVRAVKEGGIIEVDDGNGKAIVWELARCPLDAVWEDDLLRWAAVLGRWRIVKEAVGNLRVDPCARGRDGRTALMRAVSSVGTVEVGLGSRVRRPDKGMRAEALREVVEVLGGSVFETDSRGRTALHVAVLGTVEDGVGRRRRTTREQAALYVETLAGFCGPVTIGKEVEVRKVKKVKVGKKTTVVEEVKRARTVLEELVGIRDDDGCTALDLALSTLFDVTVDESVGEVGAAKEEAVVAQTDAERAAEDPLLRSLVVEAGAGLEDVLDAHPFLAKAFPVQAAAVDAARAARLAEEIAVKEEKRKAERREKEREVAAEEAKKKKSAARKSRSKVDDGATTSTSSKRELKKSKGNIGVESASISSILGIGSGKRQSEATESLRKSKKAKVAGLGHAVGLRLGGVPA